MNSLELKYDIGELLSYQGRHGIKLTNLQHELPDKNDLFIITEQEYDEYLLFNQITQSYSKWYAEDLRRIFKKVHDEKQKETKA